MKCSGERTGCERCRNQGSQCIYQESRVGKVPGIRAKKRPLDAPDDQRERRTSCTSSQFQSNSGRADSMFQEDKADSAIQWAVETRFDAMENGNDFLDDPNAQVLPTGSSSEVSGSDESMATASASEGFSLPALDFAFDDLFMSPHPHVPHPNSPSKTAQRQAENEAKERKDRDNRCVMECCQIVSDLENYIEAELKAFKLALGIVRSGLGKLNELIRTQQGSRNPRCRMLFIAIMYQLLELLDLCDRGISSDSNRPQGSSLTSHTPGLLLPSLGFGEFNMDAEDQSAWKSQMLLKEVHHASEVLRSIKTLASLSSDIPECGRAVGRVREEIPADLEFRLKELAIKISRRG